MSLESRVQWFVHTLEQGSGWTWLNRFLVAVIIAGVAVLWLTVKFNGFNTPEAMDQAQIGRQLAAGNGYTTMYARPLAMRLMMERTGKCPVPLPDVSQPPLGPLINAAVFKITRTDFAFPSGETVSPDENAITTSSFAFFAGALLLGYLLLRQLFNPILAALATSMAAGTNLLWQFTFSGLPQMAMLFFFNGALLALFKALCAQAEGRGRRALALVTTASVCLAFATLGNIIVAAIFAGFLAFVLAVFRPVPRYATASLAAYAIPLLPWAWHNWRALRNPFGLVFYELYRPAGTDALALLADFEAMLRFHWSDFLHNVAQQLLLIMGNFPSYIGANLVAAAFFLALFIQLHSKWTTAQFRWAIFFTWIGATAGMAVLGSSEPVSANQLQVLFIPVMTGYGLAFLLSMWNRLQIVQPFLRLLFVILLFAIVSIPLVLGLFNQARRVNWPPYLPPLMVRFEKWLTPHEAMASDIPWATAWYANRTSLLLPASVEQFELINGENFLGEPLVGLYLTPFSGGGRAYADIVNGRYSEWARFILREVRQEDLRSWMLGTAINLPIDGEAVFFSDRVRWR